MKTTLRLASLAAAFFLSVSAPASAEVGGLIPDPPAVDFGDAFDGESLVKEVTFTNDSDAAWIVHSVQTSCGCTAASVTGPDGQELEAKPAGQKPVVELAPGEAMTVEVQFNTTGQRGQVQKSVKIFNVDPVVPPVEVPVRARVTQGISVTPSMVNFASISKSGRVEREVLFEAIEIGDWSVSDFESGIAGWELPEFMEFEVLDEEGPSRRVKIVLEDGRPVGPLSGRVNATIEHERIRSVPFYVQAFVNPDVTFSTGNPAFPEIITFDKFAPEEKVTRTLKVKNADPDVPYTITDDELQTPKQEFFETTVRTIEEGVEYEVDITADGAIGTTFFRGNMVLKSEHPDLPAKTIPFHGWVRRSNGD